jgi:hypothetical protein
MQPQVGQKSQKHRLKTVKSIWLVVLTILKIMKVNGKDDIPYMMENKKCSKPPTSNVFIPQLLKLFRNAD